MKHMISVFSELGKRLSKTLNNIKNEEFVKLAINDNSWFTEASIKYAIDAIINNYLQQDKIEKWIDKYKIEKVNTPQNIAVIMAGNIPLVGFFDLMSVVISGNRCLYKTSSKDRVLIEYVVSLLKSIEPNILTEKRNDTSHIDAVIATGGDNTVRLFKDKYGDIPAIYRGSRFSIAVLTENETTQELKSLANDIFMHSGLGCRNVSMIFTPQHYDLNKLISAFEKNESISDKYINNYTQNRAIMKLDGFDFFDGGFFTTTMSNQSSHIISNINITNYTDIEEVKKWIIKNEDQIQCVVSRLETLPFQVNIGDAQQPTLNDYPDRVDTLSFLINIKK